MRTTIRSVAKGIAIRSVAIRASKAVAWSATHVTISMIHGTVIARSIAADSTSVIAMIRSCRDACRAVVRCTEVTTVPAIVHTEVCSWR